MFYVFVGVECVFVVGVYNVMNFVVLVLEQLLLFGVGLEGYVIILFCNLLVFVNEKDLIEDGGVCVYVMIFEQ